MIWQHGEDGLREFMSYLNSIHPTLKFTYKYSKTETEFLDVNVIKKGNSITADLYIKETDTRQYLHTNSCHTHHTKKGIPYGQALRIRRIVLDDQIFEKRCDDLESWLVKRGHESKMVANEIRKAKGKDRDELLMSDSNKSDQVNRLNLVLRYHPALSKNVHSIVKKHHTLLNLNEDHKKVFTEVPRVTYKRAKNLKDTLVRASLPTPMSTSAGSRCCGKKRCLVGKNLSETKTFTNSDGSKHFSIRKGPLDCDTENVIYLLQCKTCNIQYVGSSKPAFRLRFNNYKAQNRKFVKFGQKDVNQLELHRHFSQEDHHGFLNDALFTLIDSEQNNDLARKKEAFWQYKLNVFEPYGLNIRDVPNY